MAISFTCPCGKQLTVKDDRARKRVKCPKCGQAIVVPELAAARARQRTAVWPWVTGGLAAFGLLAAGVLVLVFVLSRRSAGSPPFEIVERSWEGSTLTIRLPSSALQKDGDGWSISREEFRLLAPDGSTVAPDAWKIENPELPVGEDAKKIRVVTRGSPGGRPDHLDVRLVFHLPDPVVDQPGLRLQLRDLPAVDLPERGTGLPAPAKPGVIVSLAFVDRRSILAGDLNGVVWLCDAVTRKPMAPLRGHDHEVSCLAVSRDGRSGLSAENDGTLLVWQLPTRTLVRHLGGSRLSPKRITCVALSPDGRRAFAGDHLGKVYIYDVTTGERLRGLDWSLRSPTLKTGLVYEVNGAAFSSDGRRLVTGDGLGNVRVWDAQTGKLLHHLAQGQQPVASVGFSPDDRYVLAAFRGAGFGASGGGGFTIWDSTRQFDMIRQGGLPGGTLQAPGGWPRWLAFLPDNRRFVLGDSDGKLWLGRADAAQEPLQSIAQAPGGGLCWALSPDGRQVASGTNEGELWLTTLP